MRSERKKHCRAGKTFSTYSEAQGK